MAKKYAPDELNDLSRQELILLVTSMQEQMEQLNANMEKLIEQISIANQQRFGRHSERLDVIDGQLDLFNEAEALSEEAGNALEPSIDEVLPQQTKRKKKPGTRDADLSGLPEESIIHSVPESTQKCSNPLRKKIGVCASHTDKAFPHFCCNRIVFNMCFRVIHAIH